MSADWRWVLLVAAGVWIASVVAVACYTAAGLVLRCVIRGCGG